VAALDTLDFFEEKHLPEVIAVKESHKVSPFLRAVNRMLSGFANTPRMTPSNEQSIADASWFHFRLS
jgi:hypothetical protein